MERIFLTAGAITGFTAVAAGAFGAHALKGRLTPELLAIFQTGVLYHLIHAGALVAAAWATGRFPGAWTTAAGISFLAGVVIFSGSLYGLALSGVRILGAITPIGGVAFLVGWLCLALAAWRS